jgi:hypothetical protein
LLLPDRRFTIATFVTLILVPVCYTIAVLDLKIVKWESGHKNSVRSE